MFNFFRKPKQESLDWRMLEIEQTGSNEHGPCDCCGNMSQTVWGFIHSPQEALAAYYVHWTPDNPNHGAHFDLMIGKWGNNTTELDRKAISLEYRVIEGQGAFMVIDAANRPVADSPLIDKTLRRDEVIGKPIAQTVFALVDAVFIKDQRIQEIRGWS